MKLGNLLCFSDAYKNTRYKSRFTDATYELVKVKGDSLYVRKLGCKATAVYHKSLMKEKLLGNPK